MSSNNLGINRTEDFKKFELFLASWDCVVKGVPRPKELAGRSVCFGNIIGHGIGAALQPVIFAISAVVRAIFVSSYQCFVKKDSNEAKKQLWIALDHACCAVTLPFLHAALAIRALFGIVNPDLYFNYNHPDNEKIGKAIIEASKPENNPVFKLFLKRNEVQNYKN